MGLSIIAFGMKLSENIREFFRKQGKIGAAKRITSISPERRAEIAKIAAQARWGRGKTSPKASKTTSTNRGAK
jgi:hypothetical protein